MNKSITNRQMTAILFLTLTTTSVTTIPKIVIESSGLGGWITVLLSSLLFGILSVLIVSLNSLFVGKALFEYSQELVGKIMTNLFSFIYIVYFFLAGILLLNTLTDIIEIHYLPETPNNAILIVSLLVCAYGAFKGINRVARLFEIYGLMFLLMLLFLHGIMFFKGRLEYIRPIFNPAELKRNLLALKELIFPFLGIEVLTIIPFQKNNLKKAKLVAFFTLLTIGLIYIIIVEASVMMIGSNEIIYYNYGMISAIRHIKLTSIEFLQRLDLLYIIIGLMGIHSGIMLIYLSLVEYTIKVIPKFKRVIHVIIIGVAFVIVINLLANRKDVKELLRPFIIILGLICCGIIPITLLIIAKVRQYVKKSS